jgi:hypothetical protein
MRYGVLKTIRLSLYAQHTSNHLWSDTQLNALPAGIRAATKKRLLLYSNRYITQHAVVWKPRAKLGTINSPPSNKKKGKTKHMFCIIQNRIEFRTRSTFQTVHKVHVVVVYIHSICDTEIKCITNWANWFNEFSFFFFPYFVHLYILLGD